MNPCQRLLELAGTIRAAAAAGEPITFKPDVRDATDLEAIAALLAWPGYEGLCSYIDRAPDTMKPGLLRAAIRACVLAKIFQPGAQLSYMMRSEDAAVAERRVAEEAGR